MTGLVTRARRPGGLRRALVLSSAGTGTARFLGAVGGILAARLLEPAGRGQLAILILFATAGALAASAGVQFWTARTVARAHGIGVASWVVRTHAIVVVGVVVVGGVALGGIVARVADVGALEVALATAFTAATALNLVLLALPNGMRFMGVVAVAIVVAAAVYAGATALLLVLDRPSLGGVLLGGTIGAAASCGIVLAWSVRAPRGSATPRRGRSEYRQAVRFGLPAGIGELVLLAMLRVDVLIVAAFLPLRDVGLYAVAVALTELLWVVPDGVAQVVLPTTASDPTRSRTASLLALTVAVTALAGAALIVFDDALLSGVFGASYSGASKAVPLLVGASLAGGAWKIIGAEVVARGRTGPRATSALVGLVAMVAVDLIAIPSLGIVGAAMGSLVGYGAAAAIVARAWSGLTPPLDATALAREDASALDRPLGSGAVTAEVPT